MFARIRDTEIYFDIEGPGLVPDGPKMIEKPVAFAIHGGPGFDHSSYKPALSPLADKLQIVYFNHRGQGRSARGAKETYTLENNVEDMEALRQYLGLKKIILIGASYGGMVALSYAAKYPANVSHLIVISTSPSHRFIERAQEILKERGTPPQQAAAHRLWSGTFEDEDQIREYMEILGPLYSLKFDLNLARERRARAVISPDAINVAFAGFLRKFDITEQLSQITAPTLVIAGRHDWIAAPEFSELIAAKIPNAELRIFEHSSHSVLVDEHKAFIDVVRGFVTYTAIQH